ncbi:MAG: geranylgeranylglycerol-phosphate geranylgeranyltransferase [Saprospiraceae bacterium]|nr:geranylgeranylglycerol-phosphate geranylgeranyltransferase [Saprospiraceae bacterium]
MKTIYKLFRVPNLLIIILTQILVRYCIIEPLLSSIEIPMVFSDLDFALLVLTTVLIAAGGYIINDYFDIKIDKTNKKGKQIVGVIISEKTAIIIYAILNILAIIIGVYISNQAGNFKYSVIFIFITFLLLFYSERYKRKFLTGNIIVAFLSAFVLIIITLFEIFALSSLKINIYFIWEDLRFLTFGYAIFAFLVSFIREIIKDIEDVEGDKEQGCRTLPIVSGELISKIVVIGFSIITIAFLLYAQVQLFQNGNEILCWYFILVQLLFGFLIYKVIIAKEKKHFRKAGNLTKIIMLVGILSMLLLLI